MTPSPDCLPERLEQQQRPERQRRYATGALLLLGAVLLVAVALLWAQLSWLGRDAALGPAR